MSITINLDCATRATLISRAMESVDLTLVDTYTSSVNTCYEFYSADKDFTIFIHDGEDSFFDDVVIA